MRTQQASTFFSQTALKAAFIDILFEIYPAMKAELQQIMATASDAVKRGPVPDDPQAVSGSSYLLVDGLKHPLPEVAMEREAERLNSIAAERRNEIRAWAKRFNVADTWIEEEANGSVTSSGPMLRPFVFAPCLGEDLKESLKRMETEYMKYRGEVIEKLPQILQPVPDALRCCAYSIVEGMKPEDIAVKIERAGGNRHAIESIRRWLRQTLPVLGFTYVPAKRGRKPESNRLQPLKISSKRASV